MQRNNHTRGGTNTHFVQDLLINGMNYPPETVYNLLLPANHQQLILTLQEVAKRIEEIHNKESASIVTECRSIEEEEYFRELYKTLSPDRQNTANRFFRELLKKQRDGLPATIDEWIIWGAGSMTIVIQDLEILCAGVSNGDPGIIKQAVLGTIIPELKKNQKFLEENDILINLPDRVIKIQSLLDIYKHIGLGYADVIQSIMLRINTQKGQEPIKQDALIIQRKAPIHQNRKGIGVGEARVKDTEVQVSTATLTLQEQKQIYSQLETFWKAKMIHLKRTRAEVHMPPFDKLIFSRIIHVRLSTEYRCSISALPELSKKIIEDTISGFNNEYRTESYIMTA